MLLTHNSLALILKDCFVLAGGGIAWTGKAKAGHSQDFIDLS
jgi:hypothetical protein